MWARPFGVLDYRELKLADGKLLLPEDLAGMYQIKVTPESTPWQHGATASEYKVQTLVEVRAAGAHGSAAAATPLGRVYFGRGEEIPLTIYVRGNVPKDTELTLTLRDGARTLAAAKAKFNPAAKEPLRSDAAVHTHMFAKPVEAARFRLVLPWGVCGNTRLAEIVFHGEVLGCSHPDVVAKRPLAVLFDEQEDIRHDLYAGEGLAISLEGAYSGGRCLTLTPPAGGQAAAGQPWRQQFGETVRNWDFEIVEHPQPGQYRWVQFAWKALSPADQGNVAQAERRRVRRLRDRRRRAHGVGRHDDRQEGRCAALRLADRPRRPLGGGQEGLAGPQPAVGRQGRGRGLRPDRARTDRAGPSPPKGNSRQRQCCHCSGGESGKC